MAKDPAFLFYPGDYLRDTQCLSEKAQVAYDRIMCEHMRNICKDVSKIGVTKDKLIFFTKRLNEDEKNDLMSVLIKSGDIFQIEWVALSICKRKSYSENRAENRRGKNKDHMKTYDSHMENENENTIENVNTNTNAKKTIIVDDLFGGPPPNQDQSIIGQMWGIWKTTFPKYTADRESDFEGLGKIFAFMCRQNGSLGIDPTDVELQIKFLNTFQVVADEVTKQPFWINKPLKSIANNIQTFYNSLKNPIDATPKQQNGRSSKIDEDKLKQKLAARIDSWKQNSG